MHRLTALILFACLLAGATAAADGPAPNPPKTTVVVAHDPAAVDRFTVAPARVRALVSSGIMTLTGQNDLGSAWHVFVSSNDVVGIKINTQAAPLLGTHRAVVAAVVEGLRAAGVPAANIWIWDRDLPRMQQLDYARPDAPPAPHEVAIGGGGGWDAAGAYENKLVGKLIWGDRLFGQPGAELDTRSHLPKLLTQTLTKLINIPVLQDHDTCGLSGCLYNLSLGLVDNARRFEMFGGDPAIAEICALPAVHRKAVLHIMDALVGGYAGGPGFKPQYAWSPASLYCSADPVAVDTLCLELIAAKRREAHIGERGPVASHIATAARLGLGQNDRGAIRLITATGSGHAGEHQQE